MLRSLVRRLVRLSQDASCYAFATFGVPPPFPPAEDSLADPAPGHPERLSREPMTLVERRLWFGISGSQDLG